ncbi:MAG TPA: hypothetical protein DIC64_00365 [Alphaproteobacteria bacterium]|nr:hypothetical protein [Alphaproteobacteria bacterium]
MKKTDIYHRTLKIWSDEHQILQAVEEMSELIKEILKNVNRKKDNIAEIIEETADVEIMLEQLKCCYQINEKVESFKAEKLKKIEQRVDEWEQTHDK